MSDPFGYRGDTPLGYSGMPGTVDEAGDGDEAIAQRVAGQALGTDASAMSLWFELRREYPFARAHRIFKRAMWLFDQNEPSVT